MSAGVYRQVFDKLLTRTDAETAHRWGFRAIQAAQPATRLLGGRRRQETHGACP